MAAFVVLDSAIQRIGNKEIDLNSDDFYAVITNTSPNHETDDLLGDLTQIASDGSYAPVAVASPTWAETSAGSGIWQWSSDPFAWTAGSGNFATGRYIYIVSDSATDDPCIGYIDYGAAFVLTAGNTLTVTPGANGLMRITVNAT